MKVRVSNELDCISERMDERRKSRGMTARRVVRESVDRGETQEAYRMGADAGRKDGWMVGNYNDMVSEIEDLAAKGHVRSASDAFMEFCDEWQSTTHFIESYRRRLSDMLDSEGDEYIDDIFDLLDEFWEGYLEGLSKRGIDFYEIANAVLRGEAVREQAINEVANPYDPKYVANVISNDLMQWVGQVDDLKDSKYDDPEIMVDTIASEYDNVEDQALDMLDNVGLEPSPGDQDDLEYWAWEIERAEDAHDEIADMLNKRSGLPGTIYFMWQDGGYRMFYTWEVEDHPELL